MQSDIQQYLIWFTRREEQLLKIVSERGLTLPERLANWRVWIGDAAIYVNELANFVELAPVNAVHKNF